MASGGNIQYTIVVNSSNAINNINGVSNAFGNLQDTGLKLMRIGTVLTASISAPLLAAAKAGIMFDSAIQQARTSYGVLLGDVSKGVAMVSEIKKFADVTPFQMPELLDAGKLMLSYGVAAESILPSMQRLGDVAGGNKEKFKHLTLAFSQVQGTGRLMGQDLLQMVSAGFNPLMEISNKTGIKLIDLRKQMEKGGISAELVAATLKMATEQGGRFYEMMDKQALTFEGRMSTLKDAVEATLGEIMLPLFNYLADTVLPHVTAAVKNLEKWFGGLSEQTKKTVLIVGALVGIVLPATVMIAAFGAMILSAITPLVLWVVAISAVVAALGYLLVTNKDFRDGVIAIWNNIAAQFNKVVGSVLDGVISLVDIWDNLDKDTKDKFKMVAQSIILLSSAFIGGFTAIVNMIGPTISLVTDSFTELVQIGAWAYQKLVGDTVGAAKTFDMIGESALKVEKDMKDMAKGFLNGGEIAVKVAEKAIDAFDKFDSKTIKDYANNLKAIKLPEIDVAKAEKAFLDFFGTGITKNEKINGAKTTVDDLLRMLKEGSNQGGISVDSLNTKVKSLVDSVRQQTKAFAEFIGVFEKVQLKGSSSGESLIRRLEKQVKTMVKWRDALNVIREKAGEKGAAYVAAIEAEGPKATKSVVGMSRLSQERIEYAADLYNKKLGIGEDVALSQQQYQASEKQKVNQIVVNITGNNIKNDADLDDLFAKLIIKLKNNGIK